MWPRLLIGGLIYVAATLPWTSQRLPRFFLPALAAGGAILIVGALVRAVVRLARPHRPNRRADATAVLVNAVATLVFVLSPAARLAGSTVGGSSGAPRMLAAFGDWRGGEGYPRLSPHRGVDIAARLGSDVLAAADGRVVVARDNNDACGLIVVIVHDPHGYRTVYCHLV